MKFLNRGEYFFFSHLTRLDYKVSYGEGSAEDDAKWTIPFSPRQGILSAQQPDQHPVINAICPAHSLFGGWVSREKDLWCPNWTDWTEDVHEHTPGTDMAKAGLKMLGESIPVTLLGTCQILSEAGFYDFFPLPLSGMSVMLLELMLPNLKDECSSVLAETSLRRYERIKYFWVCYWEAERTWGRPFKLIINWNSNQWSITRSWFRANLNSAFPLPWPFSKCH